MNERPQDQSEEHELRAADVGAAGREPEVWPAETPPTRETRPTETQVGPTRVAEERTVAAETKRPSPDIEKEFQERWNSIRTGFVDEPRKSVEEADHLVADVIKGISDKLTAKKADLEQQWNRQGDVSTEDYRLALKNYRKFFDRLLSM